MIALSWLEGVAKDPARWLLVLTGVAKQSLFDALGLDRGTATELARS